MATIGPFVQMLAFLAYFGSLMTNSRKPPNSDQTTDTATLRAIDASINRATEGLRVVEDFVRFSLDDEHLVRLAKLLRHDLTAACAVWPADLLHAARETERDVGTQITTQSEGARTDAEGICAASFQRLKQSLRSLEEFGKLACPQVAAKLEAIRYRTYTLERCVTIATESRKRLQDVRLCVLIGGQATEAAFAQLVGELLAAGVSMIQLRDKRLADAELVARGRMLVEMVRQQANEAAQHSAEPSPGPSLGGRGNSPIPFVIINDRPDVATAVQADGVHLGQDDMGVKDARAVIGPHRLVGVSTHSIEQARTAMVDGANYLGVGPTFPSTTKAFDQFPGLDLLRQVASEISLPAFAIGGIDADNLPEVLETGITRVAVSGAVTKTTDPTEAAGGLLRILQSHAG